MADHANKRIGTATLVAARLQASLDPVAVRRVLVAHHHEAHAGFAPRAELSRDVLFQVLLAFMFDAAERQTGEQPVKEHIQQIGH